MLQRDDLDAAVSICVRTVRNVDSSKDNSSSLFLIETRLNGKRFTSRPKRGNHVGWDDYLTFNLKDLQMDDLEIALLIDDEEVGSVPLTYKRIIRETKDGYEELTLKLERQGRRVGDLDITIKRFKRQEIIGGVEPIKVTLRPGADLEDSFIETVGLQRVRASKRNLFSCMDTTDLDWEFYPKKFKTKIHH